MNDMSWIKVKAEAHLQCVRRWGPIPRASPQAILSRGFAATGVTGVTGAPQLRPSFETPEASSFAKASADTSACRPEGLLGT